MPRPVGTVQVQRNRAALAHEIAPPRLGVRELHTNRDGVAAAPVGDRDAERAPGTPACIGHYREPLADQYLEIRILDPAADPQRYQEELAARGLNVELSLAAAEPGDVGRVIFQEEDTPGIKPVEAPGNCTANGNCGVGVQVPLAYRGHARIVFGRTPLPGESVEGDAPVLTPAQQAQLHDLVGKRVSEARQQLAANGQTASYRAGPVLLEAPASEVPGTWIVYDVAPLAGDVVVIWASEDGKGPDYPDIFNSTPTR